MERSQPSVRKSTSDLLTWSETPPPASPATASPATRTTHHPSDKISKVVFGGQVTEDEAQYLNKAKPCSGYKLKEMNGSSIFSDKGENGASASDKTGLRVYQQAVNGISQISFSTEEKISPKKPTSIPEVAKQRELSGTLQSDSDSKTKQISNAKYKEISGNDIFGPPPEIQPRSVAAARSLDKKDSKDMGEPAPRTVRTSVKPTGEVKMTKKIHDQKFHELTGNDIFKGDAVPGSADKSLSRAKLREMSGNDIFSDGKSDSRDYRGGVRKPPGGESSIALV
ncbi:uncharacterized protein [Rutidosis leptorrhynchoides]|uniref:uncharacterized protein isoform X3 n=1 Tax=Rutidosis leptorrhynchoides TaxID=125765 RepID=UPI003A9A0653